MHRIVQRYYICSASDHCLRPQQAVYTCNQVGRSIQGEACQLVSDRLTRKVATYD